MNPGIDIAKLFERPSSGLPMPKMPSNSVKVEQVEVEAAPLGDDMEPGDTDEATKESIGFTDSTMRCGMCRHHDGSQCGMFDIACGPEDGCRSGFEAGEESGGLSMVEEVSETPDEMVP